MIEILVIEDSKNYNNTITNLLRRPSRKIIQAFNLQEAKQKLSENKNINYILIDLSLPDGEGDELIINLKSQSKTSPKVIVLTGNRDLQRRNYLFEHGVIEFFSKETPLKILIKDIQNLIDTLQKNESKNILVIDDSKFIRKTIEQILAKKNYKIYLAQDPYEAFNILNELKKVDLIYLDLEMPKMNGLEFLEKIKADEKYKKTPILILSNDSNRENYARALRHGAIDFIRKPFIIEEILLKTNLHVSQLDYVVQIETQAQELQEYKRILNESDILSRTDANGVITEVNDKFCEVSGFSKEYLIGKTHRVVRHPDTPKKIFEELWNKIENHQTFKGIIKNRRRDGTSYYVDATISPVIDVDGNIEEIIGLRHDITDIMNPKKQLIADISYIENPTLIFFQIVNYDIFKEFYSETVMHTFEYELEQVILNYFPQELQLKKVYNLGNGLFGFLKNKKLPEEYIILALQKVLDKFSKIGISFKETHYDIDICLSFSNEGTHILDDVYLGIQQGIKDKVSIINANYFHRHAQVEARNKLKNISIIKKALNKTGKFTSFFQPIVNVKTMETEKYESLIRLIDENNKEISPFYFLDTAKKTGYYLNITEIVIKNTLAALEKTDKKICINLSSSDLENKFIREQLLQLVSKEKNKGRITFELLEDEDIKDFEIIKDFIIECKLKGSVKIAIDDFGSGYSNYERLLDFQPDILKIDGSLTKNILIDSYSLHIIESIILFAKKQNIKTVAEFVSNEDIFNKVKSLGVDYVQGYYLGEPKKLF